MQQFLDEKEQQPKKKVCNTHTHPHKLCYYWYKGRFSGWYKGRFSPTYWYKGRFSPTKVGFHLPIGTKVGFLRGQVEDDKAWATIIVAPLLLLTW